MAKIPMPTAATIRAQVETALARRVPSALTPSPRIVRPVSPSGVGPIDELLNGGLPVGAITEIVGAEGSGRTSLVLSFIAQVTQAAKVCAWVDVSDALQPESAAAAGVALHRLLWVRCGVNGANVPDARKEYGFSLPAKYLIPQPIKRGLHGGGFGPHPRGEVKGLSHAVGDLLRPAFGPRCAEPQPRAKVESIAFEPLPVRPALSRRPLAPGKPWKPLDQALRVTDLLLQGGGFSAIVLDMGSIAPEYASRVPLATWFRYRAAAEKSQATILLLTQHPCAKSSAELVLRLRTLGSSQDDATVLGRLQYSTEVSRQRFTESTSNVIPLRKPPQRATTADWHACTAWAGVR